MRGIPDKIATKQDLFNICNDLHHAEAKVFLKNIAPEELKRLSVTRNDIKQIKIDLANRKRKETIENRELAHLKSSLEKNQTRLEEVRAAIREKGEDLKTKIAGREMIDPKTEELKVFQQELAALRKLPDQIRGIAAILRDLNGMIMELSSIYNIIDECDSEIEEICIAAELVLVRKDKIADLHAVLKSARIAEQQKRSVAAKLAEIEEITLEIKVLREGAESIEQTERELQGLGKELKKLEDEAAELRRALREV